MFKIHDPVTKYIFSNGWSARREGHAWEWVLRDVFGKEVTRNTHPKELIDKFNLIVREKI